MGRDSQESPATPARNAPPKVREPREAGSTRAVATPREAVVARDPAVVRDPAATRDPAAPREPRRQRSERRPAAVTGTASEPQPLLAVPAAAVPAADVPADVPADVTIARLEVAGDESGNPPRRRGRRGGRRERGERVENPIEGQTDSREIAGVTNDGEGDRPGNAAPIGDADQTRGEFATTAQPEPAATVVAAVMADAAPASEVAEQPQNPVAQPLPLILAEPPADVEAVATVFDPLAGNPAQPAAAPAPTVTVPLAEAPSVSAAAAIELPVIAALAPESAPALFEQALPAVQTVEPLAVIPPRKAMEESGLIMVETRRDKVPALPPESGDSIPERAQRRRRAVVVVADEPLVMVETRK
jgi:ribonuclease E